MPQATPFDQAVQVLGKICTVVAGTLQRLSHQQDFEAGSVALGDRLSEMFLE